MATAISNWRESTYTTMKPQAANMSPALFWLISNPVPWTQSDRDLTDKFSDQITLFLDSREQETTGQRDITQKAPEVPTEAPPAPPAEEPAVAEVTEKVAELKVEDEKTEENTDSTESDEKTDTDKATEE